LVKKVIESPYGESVSIHRVGNYSEFNAQRFNDGFSLSILTISRRSSAPSRIKSEENAAG